MARTFNDSIEEDVERTFLNTNEWAVFVTIRRRNVSTPNVPALVSQKQDYTDSDHTAGIGTNVEARDYRIQANKYKIQGFVVLPARSDRIIEVLRNGDRLTCEVLPTEDGPPFEADSHGTFLLVHTKVLKRE